MKALKVQLSWLKIEGKKRSGLPGFVCFLCSKTAFCVSNRLVKVSKMHHTFTVNSGCCCVTMKTTMANVCVSADFLYNGTEQNNSAISCSVIMLPVFCFHVRHENLGLNHISNVFERLF